MKNEPVSAAVRFIGADDLTLDLFESQYPVPNGVSYNSYLILDEKVAVMDTVDARATDQWLQNLEAELGGRTPDYLVVSHMEPDHAANAALLCEKYPAMQVVGNAKTFPMLEQFFGPGAVPAARRVLVKEGDTLPLGAHTLQFFMAPMVHWPEVMVTYEQSEGLLFSADGFGRFGSRDPAENWAGEARRYYLNIVGKYGVQVQALLKKAAGLQISAICPLHGPVLRGEAIGKAVALYDTWSSYRPEEPEMVMVAYASIHGHTRAAALRAAELLKAGGAQVVTVDLSRVEVSYAVASAFRCGKLLLACATYDGGLFPPMESFLHHLKAKNYQKRVVGLVENGTWAPMAAKQMRAQLELMKAIEIRGEPVTIRSALNAQSEAALKALCSALLA